MEHWRFLNVSIIVDITIALMVTKGKQVAGLNFELHPEAQCWFNHLPGWQRINVTPVKQTTNIPKALLSDKSDGAYSSALTCQDCWAQMSLKRSVKHRLSTLVCEREAALRELWIQECLRSDSADLSRRKSYFGSCQNCTCKFNLLTSLWVLTECSLEKRCWL